MQGQIVAGVAPALAAVPTGGLGQGGEGCGGIFDAVFADQGFASGKTPLPPGQLHGVGVLADQGHGDAAWACFPAGLVAEGGGVKGAP